MAGEWRSSNWGEEVTLEYGKAIRGYSPVHGKYRVFGSNGPIGWTSEALTQGPGVILGRKGAYRGVEYWREPFWVIDTAYYLVPKTELDMRWLYYAVKHYKLGEVDDGSPIPSTTRAAVYMLELDVPPKPEQRAITHILGTLDDKIELNRRRNQTLEAMARALFNDWFVDFGPVRAKMEGREPYLPADLWQLFPDRLDDDGKPEAWKMVPLNELATLETSTVSPRQSPEAIFEHYSIPAFDAGCMPVMELGDSIKSNKYKVHADAVLVSKLNPQTPRVWLPKVSTDHAVCSTEFMQFVPRRRDDRPFLYYLMSSEMMQEEVLKHVTGSTGSRQRAQPSQIAKVGVLLAGAGIQGAFNRKAESILQAIADNRCESQTLAQLRDTLLPKLISGELRITDAENFMDRVAPQAPSQAASAS